MIIAFFDFDGTITKGDSFALFLRFILGRKFYAKLLLVSFYFCESFLFVKIV